jgi:hypothetical protein
MDDGPNAMDVGRKCDGRWMQMRWTLDANALDVGRKCVGRCTVDDGRWTQIRWTLDANAMDVGRKGHSIPNSNIITIK